MEEKLVKWVTTDNPRVQKYSDEYIAFMAGRRCGKSQLAADMAIKAGQPLTLEIMQKARELLIRNSVNPPVMMSTPPRFNWAEFLEEHKADKEEEEEEEYDETINF